MSTRIAGILADRDWQLIGPDNQLEWPKFVDHVVELTGARESEDKALSRTIVTAYCPILYAACADQGSGRQRRAFTELWRWIYPRVRRRIDVPQDAEDVAQQVMLKAYQNLHQVKDPRGFLGWVSVITFHEIGEYYRRKRRENKFERGLAQGPENDTDNGDEMDGLTGPDDLLETELQVAKEDLVRRIYDCMPKDKRRQAEVLIALVLEDLTVLEVAQNLQTTPANVHVLFFRAKKGLLEHCSNMVEMLLQHLTPSQRAAHAEEES